MQTNATRRPPTAAELAELRRRFPPATPGVGRDLSERFLLPPFSVLNAREGWWQKRKRMWIDLGIQSELGRGEGASMTNASDRAMELAGGFSERHGRSGDCTPGGRGANSAYVGTERRMAKAYNMGLQASKENDWSVEDDKGSGTSIFDPVLCEIAYRWFCPPGGRVLDPFAGGSVRGIVAAKLGRGYAGVDLRPEQAEANYAQAEWICQDCAAEVEWAVGDSMGIRDLLPGEYDLVFSCPPYADLERYSDDPRDLSTMEYPRFLDAYRHIIAESCAMLRDDRFACFVVGDVRGPDGNYRGFVVDTIAAFRDAGLALYNQAILVTAVGSLPIRVGRQFAGYRKLGNTHQHILVFLKGDAGRASAACGDVDVDDLPMPDPVAGGVAVVAQDCADLPSEGLVDGDGAEVVALPLPRLEAALLADVLRGEARAAGRPVPRTWVEAGGAWSRVYDDQDLTYLAGGAPYLSRAVFPDARGPVDVAPTPRRLR